jgi:N6-L-threonylcarbamoyladenine synthase
MYILGIDTSCDDTSAAVTEDLRILSSRVRSQTELHETFGGIVPEDASRAHVKHIDGIVRLAMEEAGITFDQLDLITATNGPGLVGSLLIGLNYAKALALAGEIPFYPANHLFSHVYSNFLDREPPPLPAISVVVSGGHTSIGILDEKLRHVFHGSTLDDAVGEVIDKVGRKLGLPYPAGPHVDGEALAGNVKAVRFPRPLKGREGYDFSFSGLKTAFLRAHEQEIASNTDLFSSLMMAISDCLADRIRSLSKTSGVKRVFFSGGVAASGFFREHLPRLLSSEGMEIYFPPRSYCTDNAAMVCASGFLEAGGRNFEQSITALDCDAFSSFF